jgi:gas vesicle protein
MNTNSKVILGLVGAAAAGVVVGLLLAPEKGTDTRQKITKTAGDWGTQLSDLFANAKEELNNLTNKGSKVANDAASRYSNTTESFS